MGNNITKRQIKYNLENYTSRIPGLFTFVEDGIVNEGITSSQGCYNKFVCDIKLCDDINVPFISEDLYGNFEYEFFNNRQSIQIPLFINDKFILRNKQYNKIPLSFTKVDGKNWFSYCNGTKCDKNGYVLDYDINTLLPYKLKDKQGNILNFVKLDKNNWFVYENGVLCDENGYVLSLDEKSNPYQLEKNKNVLMKYNKSDAYNWFVYENGVLCDENGYVLSLDEYGLPYKQLLSNERDGNNDWYIYKDGVLCDKNGYILSLDENDLPFKLKNSGLLNFKQDETERWYIYENSTLCDENGYILSLDEYGLPIIDRYGEYEYVLDKNKEKQILYNFVLSHYSLIPHQLLDNKSNKLLFTKVEGNDWYQYKDGTLCDENGYILSLDEYGLPFKLIDAVGYKKNKYWYQYEDGTLCDKNGYVLDVKDGYYDDGTKCDENGNIYYSYRTLIDIYYKYKPIIDLLENKIFKKVCNFTNIVYKKLQSIKKFIDFIEEGIGIYTIESLIDLYNKTYPHNKINIDLEKSYLIPSNIYIATAIEQIDYLNYLKLTCQTYEDLMNDETIDKNDKLIYKELCCECEKYTLYGGEEMIKLLEFCFLLAKNTSNKFYNYSNKNASFTIPCFIQTSSIDLGISEQYRIKWEPGKEYLEGDIIFYNNNSWLCTNTTTGKIINDVITFDYDNFKLINDSELELISIGQKLTDGGNCFNIKNGEIIKDYTLNGTTTSRLRSLRRYKTFIEDGKSQYPSINNDWLYYYRLGVVYNNRLNDTLCNLVKIETDESIINLPSEVLNEVDKVLNKVSVSDSSDYKYITVGESNCPTINYYDCLLQLSEQSAELLKLYFNNFYIYGNVLDEINIIDANGNVYVNGENFINNELSLMIEFKYTINAHLRPTEITFEVNENGQILYYCKNFEKDNTSLNGLYHGISFNEKFPIENGSELYKLIVNKDYFLIPDGIVLHSDKGLTFKIKDLFTEEDENNKSFYKCYFSFNDYIKGKGVSYKKNIIVGGETVTHTINMDIPDTKKYSFTTVNNVKDVEIITSNNTLKIKELISDFNVKIENKTDYEYNYLYKTDYLLSTSYQPYVENDVVIDRGNADAFEQHLKLLEIKSMFDLENYQNGGFFKIEKLN